MPLPSDYGPPTVTIRVGFIYDRREGGRRAAAGGDA